MDSDHRSETQQIYSLPPLATREHAHIKLENGAGGRTRTPDLLITNQLLYQLSYTSIAPCYYLATYILYHVHLRLSSGFLKKICSGRERGSSEVAQNGLYSRFA